MDPGSHTPDPLLIFLLPASLVSGASTSNAFPVLLPPKEVMSIHGHTTTGIVGCCLRGSCGMRITDGFTLPGALVLTDGDSTNLNDVGTHMAIPDADDITFPRVPAQPIPLPPNDSDPRGPTMPVNHNNNGTILITYHCKQRGSTRPLVSTLLWMRPALIADCWFSGTDGVCDADAAMLARVPIILPRPCEKWSFALT
jgi:hypothetical protein